MASQKQKFLDTAKRLVDQSGASATISTQDTGTYDPSTGDLNPSSTSSAMVNISPPENFSLSSIDGDAVLKSDLRTIVPAKGLSLSPVSGMKLTYNGTQYTIVDVQAQEYQGEVIFYEVQLRK